MVMVLSMKFAVVLRCLSLQNVTFDQIIDERRMELCCEWGEHYNDLVRTGKAATELVGLGSTGEGSLSHYLSIR